MKSDRSQSLASSTRRVRTAQQHSRKQQTAATRDEPAHASRPYVIVNMAMTADGKIATANRALATFGSRTDHDHLLALRATADAVLCGAATAGGKNISLGPGPLRFRQQRRHRGLAEFNLRVIASGSANLDPGSSIFKHRFSPILVITTGSAPTAKLERLRAVAHTVAVFGQRQLNLPAALKWLRRQWKVNRLICEGGGELNDAMFRAGLVDELHLTVCPLILGGRAAPTISEGSGFERLARAAQLKLKTRRWVNGELFLVYTVGRGEDSRSRVSAQRASSQSKSARRLK